VPLQSPPNRLSPELLQGLGDIKSIRAFPKGVALFRQGEMAAGLYVVQSGAVRILLQTAQNQKQLLEMAGPGSVLGLSESMSGESHRITAEAGADTTAVFIPADKLLTFLGEHSDFSMQIVRLLSEELHGLYGKFRNISSHPGRPRQRQLDQQLN